MELVLNSLPSTAAPTACSELVQMEAAARSLMTGSVDAAAASAENCACACWLSAMDDVLGMACADTSGARDRGEYYKKRGGHRVMWGFQPW